MRSFDPKEYYAFLSLADNLRVKGGVSEEEWEALFNMPGYRAVFRSTTSKLLKMIAGLDEESFKRLCLEAFTVDGQVSSAAEYLCSAHSSRDEVEGFLEELDRAEEDIVGKAIETLSPWLKTSLHVPRIHLGVYLVDSIGYPEVAVDVIAALQSRGHLDKLLAHELFHYHTLRALPAGVFDVGDDKLTVLLAVLSIHQEGIADHVACLFKHREGLREAFEHAVGNARGYVEELDRRLSHIYRGGDPTALVELLRGIPFGGHALGYHMAEAIVEAFGVERLASTSTKPIGFFRAYCEAAEALGEKPLSRETLLLLEDLLGA